MWIFLFVNIWIQNCSKQNFGTDICFFFFFGQIDYPDVHLLKGGSQQQQQQRHGGGTTMNVPPEHPGAGGEANMKFCRTHSESSTDQVSF